MVEKREREREREREKRIEGATKSWKVMTSYTDSNLRVGSIMRAAQERKEKLGSI